MASTQEDTDDSAGKAAGAKPKFRGPPCRHSKGVCNSSHSDSSGSGILLVSKKKRNRAKTAQKLPPLGIFWDIENCGVPKGKSASAVVQKIREAFLEGYREAEFVVVCDVKKENPLVIQELHDSQVNLIHVASISKNAADEKLRQSLRRFAEVHPAPSAIVLMSGDVNFAADLSDLRYRKKIRVILVHNCNAADALILCANEHHSFRQLTESLPSGTRRELVSTTYVLKICNLTKNIEPSKLKNRIQMLTENCGGKCLEIYSSEGIAYVKFGSFDLAIRAQKRIQGEDVFGNKIKVLSPSLRHYTGRKIKNGDNSFQTVGSYNLPPPPPGFNSQDLGKNTSFTTSNVNNNVRRFPEANLHSLPPEKIVGFRPIRGMGAGGHITPMEVTYDQNWPNRSRSEDRRPPTPQDQGACALSFDNKDYYSGDNGTKNAQQNQPVDLIISNLDHTLEIKELKRLLTNMIKEFAVILSMNVIVQADGTPVVIVKVSSAQEAQFIISQLHRQKLGFKRMVISYAQTNQPNTEHLKVMVVTILQEVPDKSMPLFKFLELLESRYQCTVSVSEVNKLKDVCKITDDMGPRIISLTQEVKMSPPPNLSGTLVPYCVYHCPNGLQNRGWCELSTNQATNVRFPFKLFAMKVISLLNLHLGSFPFLSFQICYETEFNEALPVDETGVPLEHLITCVPKVEIQYAGPNKNIKIIKHNTNAVDVDENSILKGVAPLLAPNINLLCRELVDLLKTTEKCQLLLTKFIPAYHHHFGRQCRVADYGYTKLLDLFESISHVVQIMGDGSRRVITLTHQAQMRRFTSDLLRVLKVQPSKQIPVNEFPAAYEKVMHKAFNAVEYGLCTFDDLLSEVPENTIVITQNEDGIMISIPKREQTAEEVMRTKQFASEVIDLLRHSPYFKMIFNKFVPAYHHHFGHQCRVSDYGFTKLIELFEAIPEIVKIEDITLDGERTISLTTEQALRVLGSQLLQIVKSAKGPIMLEEVPLLYFKEYGYPFKCHVFGCESVAEVVEKLPDYVQEVHSNAGSLLVAADVDTIPNILRVRSWALLLEAPHSKLLSQFRADYRTCYGSGFLADALNNIKDIITIDNNFVTLTPLYVLAVDIYKIICNNGGCISFGNLEKFYCEFYGKPLKLSTYNIHSVDAFYNCFSLFFYIRSNKKKSLVVLDRNLPEHLLPLQVLYTNSSHFEVGNNKEEGEAQWGQTKVGAHQKKISPPKPDTPPTPGTSSHWNTWATPSKFSSSLNLSIQMPILQNPMLLGDPENLISPARQLLHPSRNPWKNDQPVIKAPDPHELPMPDKLLKEVADVSADSGVNIKLDNSPSDNEADCSETEQRYNGAKKPYYGTFLKF